MAPVEALAAFSAPRSVPPAPLAVLVVDDHAVVRESLAILIESTEGFALWGTAESGEDALAQLHAQTPRPRIALLDLSMGGMGGIGLLERVRAMWPEMACVVLSAHQASIYSPQAAQAGARAYVEKGDPDELLSVLRDIGADGGAPEL